MKSKVILVFLMAVFALVSLAMLVNARTLNMTIAATVNGVVAAGVTISENTGSTIPVRVEVRANEDVTDAKVRVYISGENNAVETGRFDLLSGRTYSKFLSVKVPQNIRTSPSKEYVLVVVVESNDGDARATYSLTVQRESHNLELLSVEMPRSVTAGSTLTAEVVLKNRGAHESEDSFVVMRIPALDVEKKVYFGDVTPVDNFGGDYDEEDAMEGRVSLKVPSDAKAGIYDVEIEAYDEDGSVKTVKRVVVSGFEQGSDVMTAAVAKDVAAGSSATYDLIIVNSGNRIAVYSIVPEDAQNLVVSVDDAIVTVPAESSKIVKVKVQTGDVMGTYNFAVNVNSQGQLVKKVNLTANVVKSVKGSSNVVIWTVVLAIVFIVLLVVLIVLLTRKPEKTEQLEESYY